MTRLAVGFLLAFVAFSFSGCLTYKQVQLKEFKDFEIKSLTTDGVDMVISAQIENPNSYKISVTDYDLEIFLNETSLGKPNVKEKLVLPKKSNQVHSLTVTADLSAIVSQGFGAMLQLMAASEVQFKIKGSIKAKAMGVKKSFEVDESFTYEK